MTDSQILLSIPVIGVVSEKGESAQETFQNTSQQPSDAATPEEQPEQKGVQSRLRSSQLKLSTIRD